MAQVVLISWSLLIGSWFFMQHGGGLSAFALLRSLLVAFSLMLASIGFGARLMMKQPQRSWDICFVIGLLGWGTLLLPVSALGGLHLSILCWAPMLYWAWRFRNEIEWPPLTRHWLPFVGFGGVALWVLSHSSMDTDALYYHVSLPKQMWMQNGLVGGELKPNGSRPLLFHLPLGQLYGLGGQLAVGFFCGMVALAFSFSLLSRTEQVRTGSSWFVGLLLLGSFSFLDQSSVPANNVMTGFVVWLTFWVSRTPTRGWLGILMGFAVAMKYTSFGVVAAIWMTAKGSYRQKGTEAGIALCVAGVWLLRNWWEGLHPFFPYAGWELEMPFVFLEKYGLGRDWRAMLLLPWNVIMNAEVDQFQFLGRLSPLFLFAAPFGLWTGFRHQEGRRLLFILWVGGVFWALGPHWIRHLFPMMGILVFGLAISMNWCQKGLRIASLLVFGLGASANWNPYVDRYSELLQEKPSAPGDGAVRWINEHTSSTDDVAYFFAWSGSGLDRRYVLGSVEDHTPVRHWLLSRRSNALRDLRKEGVRYVLVGPHRFLSRSYSFLSEEAFEAQFDAPIEILEELLLKESRLVHTDGGYKVYQLVTE